MEQSKAKQETANEIAWRMQCFLNDPKIDEDSLPTNFPQIMPEATPDNGFFPFGDQREADRWFEKYIMRRVFSEFERRRDEIVDYHRMHYLKLYQKIHGHNAPITETTWQAGTRELLMLTLAFSAGVEVLRSPLVNMEQREAMACLTQSYEFQCLCFTKQLVRCFGNGTLKLPSFFPFSDENMQYEYDRQTRAAHVTLAAKKGITVEQETALFNAKTDANLYMVRLLAPTPEILEYLSSREQAEQAIDNCDCPLCTARRALESDNTEQLIDAFAKLAGVDRSKLHIIGHDVPKQPGKQAKQGKNTAPAGGKKGKRGKK